MRVIVFIIMMMGGNVLANEKCINTWKDFNELPDRSAKEWVDFARGRCNDSDFIKFQEGWVYLEGGSVETLKKAYKSFLQVSSDFDESFRFLGLSKSLMYLSVVSPQYKKEYKKLIDEYLERNPDSFDGNMALAKYFFNDEQYSNAVNSYLEALEKKDDLVAFRDLVISFQKIGKFENSLEYMDRLLLLSHKSGVSKEDVIYKDVWLMYSVALSFSSIGKRTEAKAFLALVRKHNVEEKGSARFSAYLNEVSRRLDGVR